MVSRDAYMLHTFTVCWQYVLLPAGHSREGGCTVCEALADRIVDGMFHPNFSPTHWEGLQGKNLGKNYRVLFLALSAVKACHCA